ncbi:MAG: efflux RND transporter permease subunit [Rhodospirillaceae bacterium]|nr:efflux RND transporter permease subunit [Rhodospirillaceae bacterium]
MRFTDIFIKRPVLASVVSLLILLLGLKALTSMQVRQYPEIDTTVITVTTTYSGADAALVQGFLTDPIQKAVAKADGIDYITSVSRGSTSVVTARVRLNFDPNTAMTEVMSQVSAVKSELPAEAEEPVITKVAGKGTALMYLSFTSADLEGPQITDYVDRVVRPKLATVPGVASVTLMGAQTFAMRVWLDPEAMAQRGMTAAEVTAALTANNYQAASGALKGYYDTIDIKAGTTVGDVDSFESLVIRTTDAGPVRLRDIAKVTLGAESTDTRVIANGEEALFVAIDGTPDSNSLDVVAGVYKVLPDVEGNLPPAIKMNVNYDSTVFIQESIHEVVKTLTEAAIIVILVILMFMASFRSVIIPMVTIPLSLVGVGIIMLALGFSLNLMTLLAFVLAIGLVVDDAIVVVENVHRHIEEGYSPFDAAILGTREIAGPVVTMTITLAAVYAPIAFLGGLTGALFMEFALTLAGSVIVSGIVALTLSPMMCSKILRKHTGEERLVKVVDAYFSRLSNGYESMLARSLASRGSTLALAVIVLLSLPLFFRFASSELAPTEDKGFVIADITGPASANADYMRAFAPATSALVDQIPEKQMFFFITGTDATYKGIGGLVLKPWSERSRNATQIQGDLQAKLNQIAGLKMSAFQLPPLPGTDGMPVQYAVTTTADYKTLYGVMQDVEKAVKDSGLFVFYDFDLKFNRPELSVVVNRDKAGEYGVTMKDIGLTLSALYASGYVNRTDILSKSYKVIPQAPRAYRLDPALIERAYVPTRDGGVVPLSNVVDVEVTTQPQQLNQFNQLNAFTLSGVPMPGVGLGKVVEFLDQTSAEILPKGFSFDYAGQSRQYKQEGSALVATFVFALVVIFLVLAAQYESVRDPLVIMTSVPLSIVGAMLPLVFGMTTLNIYSEIGLVTLIGLITKHGILICEVAKAEQEGGKSKSDAVAHAASLRLRPILMTTAAMVAGVLPLTFATGAGAESRFAIGIVIACGLSVGTLFTLFVLPVIYTLLADDHRAKFLARPVVPD